MAQGTIKWFSNESDYGFVCPDDGGPNVYVRRGHMVGDRAETLEKGDRVTYDMPQDVNGLWATNVSRESRHSYYARLVEVGRSLTQESADAYEDFLDSLFFYYGENARAGEKSTREG